MNNLAGKLDSINTSISKANEKTIDRIVEIDTDKIKVNSNNFYDDEYELDKLVESIKEVGLIEPLIVTKDYVLLSGHRRLNAIKQAGIKNVKCVFREGSSDDIITLIEANRYRTKSEAEILKEIETLQSYYQEQEQLGHKPKGRLRDLIAKDLGISSATVQRKLSKVKKVVSSDTKESTKESVEFKEFKKLKNQLKKMIKLQEKGQVFINKYNLHLIYKLFDHIDLDSLQEVDEGQEVLESIVVSNDTKNLK